MSRTLREIRDFTGLSQQKFADSLGIPVATYRKWEQGEARPAPYVTRLIFRCYPAALKGLEPMEGDGNTYYYDRESSCVYDRKGTAIPIKSDLSKVKKENIPVYLNRLFTDYYDILEKFERDCVYDQKEDIIWKM